MPNTITRITRRRFLTILAGAAGVPMLGSDTAPVPRMEWRGVALGADARMIFAGLERSKARAVMAETLAEVARLERVFSLYRPDSEISRLNATGVLDAPSQDMVALLAACRHFHMASDGAFDPSVQPLWSALTRHFSLAPDTAPPPELIEDALRYVDFGRVVITSGRIALGPGMALTLNGIAQGYITDRVSELLKEAGLRRVLVQMGETRALPGEVWRIAVPGLARTMRLRDGALATSCGGATPIGQDGTWTHLFDPRRGRPRAPWRSVSVVAPNATMADALSTAIAVMHPAQGQALASRFPTAEVIALSQTGDVRRLGRITQDVS